MTALSITSIELGSDAEFSAVEFGAAAAMGGVIKDKADGNRWKNGDATDSEVLAGKDGAGILIHPVSQAGRYGIVVTGGTIYIDDVGMLVKGQTLILGGTTVGDITEDGDAVSGWFKTILGVIGTLRDGTETTDQFLVNINVTGQDYA